MMMEAIRLSLAAEDERQRKEEKGARKEGKKRAKEAKKEAKIAEKAGKAARKNSGGAQSLYPVGSNDSSTTWATSSMARSTSNLGQQPPIPEEDVQGKGKAPAQDFAGFKPLSDPTSTLNTEVRDSEPNTQTTAPSSAARHLEESRANLQPTTASSIPMPSPLLPQREPSNTSSMASSLNDCAPPTSNLPSAGGSALDVSTPNPGTDTPQSTSNEPLLNFRSLAAMIGEEDEKNAAAKESDQHIEHAPAPTAPAEVQQQQTTRLRNNSGESSSSASAPRQSPPVYDEDEIQPAPPTARVVPDVESKNAVDVNVLDGRMGYEATQ